MTRVIGEQDYSSLAQDLLARAVKQGATASDVMVADGETLSVQVRMGAVDRLTKAREKRLGREQNCREQNQERHQPVEQPLRCPR